MTMWIQAHSGEYVNTAHLSRLQVTNQWKGLEDRWQVRGFFAADGLGSMGIILGLDFDTEDDARFFAGHAMGLV
jgi:hypothetical protein